MPNTMLISTEIQLVERDKQLKSDVIININIKENAVTITATNSRQIGKWQRYASRNPDCKQVSIEATRRGKIISVSWTMPAGYVRIRKYRDPAIVAKQVKSAARAREYKRKQD